MAVNSLFHTSNLHSIATERNLYSDLIKEAIQIYGHDVYYMDRTLVGEDMVLGIDSISQYKNQHPIEMYMEDADGGFAGEKELMNQFGLQNLSEAIFVVNKERFQELDAQVQIESGTDTSSSGSLLLEAGSVDQSSSASTLTTVTGDNNFYIIQDIAVTDADRPQEGDAIYHPVLDKMFQVNFVDHDEPFYQLDNNPVYKLHCRLYDYSSEVIDTGITALDAIETEHSLDALVHQFTLEQSSAVNEEIRLEYTPEHGLLLIDSTDGSAGAGDNIIGEDDTQSAGESIMLERPADTGDDQYLIQEDYIVGDMSTDMTSQNEYFETQSRPILDFSESNPFGDAGSSS